MVANMSAPPPPAAEAEIEARLAENFRLPGFVMNSALAQNLDRMVGIYRACKRTGRMLLLDIYAMEMLRAAGNDNLPNVGWPNLSVYVPEYQRRRSPRVSASTCLSHTSPRGSTVSTSLRLPSAR